MTHRALVVELRDSFGQLLDTAEFDLNQNNLYQHMSNAALGFNLTAYFSNQGPSVRIPIPATGMFTEPEDSPTWVDAR